jgi:hypothetical protein
VGETVVNGLRPVGRALTVLPNAIAGTEIWQKVEPRLRRAAGNILLPLGKFVGSATSNYRSAETPRTKVSSVIGSIKNAGLGLVGMKNTAASIKSGLIQAGNSITGQKKKSVKEEIESRKNQEKKNLMEQKATNAKLAELAAKTVPNPEMLAKSMAESQKFANRLRKAGRALPPLPELKILDEESSSNSSNSNNIIIKPYGTNTNTEFVEKRNRTIRVKGKRPNLNRTSRVLTPTEKQARNSAFTEAMSVIEANEAKKLQTREEAEIQLKNLKLEQELRAAERIEELKSNPNLYAELLSPNAARRYKEKT